MVEVRVEDRQHSIPIDLGSVKPVVESFLLFEGVKGDEVSIYFVGKEEISELHEEYFDDPTPTDCISFPMDDDDENHLMLGDLFVCPEVAKEYVESEGGELYQEITLYVIHGLLHLVGYDDIDEEERAEMRAAERRHMESLAKSSLFLYPVR